MKTLGTITNADEIFFYFEMLRSLQPKSVLDIGMFLKRIGAVSRQVMSTELPEGITLYGIDFFADYEMPIYNIIYDKVLTERNFLDKLRQDEMHGMHADVAVMLEVEDLLEANDAKVLWEYIYQNVDGVMTEVKVAEQQVNKGNISGYYPVGIGAVSYAWIPIAEVRK